MSRFFAIVAAVSMAGAPSCLFAQSYDNPGLGQKPVASHPRDYKPLGIRAGSFMLHPGVELAAQYRDNVLYSNSNTISDWVYHIRPYITAQSTWSRHSFTARVAADIARFGDYSFRDYEDYFLQLGGRIDVLARSSFSWGLDYMQLHEERNIRSAEQGIEPTTYELFGGSLGYDHLFNRFSVGLLYNFQQMDFDDNINLEDEIIDNQDRDRMQHNLSARFGYQFKSDKQAFMTIGYSETDFDQEFDRNGYSRDSTGFNVGAGINFSVTGVLNGDVSINYLERSYDDDLLPETSGWGLSAGLTWAPTLLTTVRGNISTSIEDTTQASSSGYLRTMYSLRVDHELLRDLQINGKFSYYVNDYQLVRDAPEGSREEDTMYTLDFGATYFVNRFVWLSASYKYANFETNVPNDDFEANTFWLVLGLER